jgi:hypothetical protein
MPYVVDSPDREKLDPALFKLASALNDLGADGDTSAWAGRVNYLVTRLMLRTLPKRKYWVMALGVGTLICVILEFYRRFVARYEDEAIIRNGDIPEYEEAA